MAGWGIAEWYGEDVLTMEPKRRAELADHAINATRMGIKNAPQPVCPFLSSIKPGALCSKKGGVCSVRQYVGEDPTVVLDAQPTTLCPNRFLEFRGEESLFAYIARELFGATENVKVIKEIPFLQKETLDGLPRGAKAGRIDWIVVPRQPVDGDSSELAWIAVETQGVYFSGDAMLGDFVSYQRDPSQIHFPAGKRRPDYRSSGAKRLAPQLEAKSPVMNRWGKKIAVVVDEAFFAEFGALTESTDFDNAEIVWIVVRYDTDMSLRVSSLIFSELIASIGALQAAKPVNKQIFEMDLRLAILGKKAGKVYDA